MSQEKSFKEKYKESLKSMDTEENIDLMFYRPIGYCWATLCAKLGIVPNVITIASIFLGLAAGIMFYFDNLWYNVIGMLLLIWADSFDSADGQLARMTKQYSRLGRILDGVSGDIWFAAIYIAICLREGAPTGFFADYVWAIWLMAVVAGLFHAKQAAMADYYRQFHLYFLKGKDGSELESLSNLNKKYSELSWSKNFGKKFVMMFYRNYTAQQEGMTPNMQKLRKTLKDAYGEEIPQTFRDAFRAKSKPLMKYTNWLSFNLRVIALFVSLFVGEPWLYFVFELTVLNIMLIYMWRRHEYICKNFVTEVENEKY